MCEPSTNLCLQEHERAWLLDNVDVAAEHDDLTGTYSFSHPAIASRESAGRKVRDGAMYWYVQFRDDEGIAVLEYPLGRSVLRGRLFSGGEDGAVVRKHVLRVDEKLRRRSIATSIYAAEEELCRKWKVREIQIPHAVDDGLVFWVRRHGYLPTEADVLRKRYARWASRRGRPSAPPVHPRDYPDDFLRSLGNLSLYKAVA